MRVARGRPRAAGALEAFIGGLLRGTPGPDQLDHARATEEWLRWLGKYADRIDSEALEWAAEPDYEAARERELSRRPTRISYCASD